MANDLLVEELDVLHHRHHRGVPYCLCVEVLPAPQAAVGLLDGSGVHARFHLAGVREDVEPVDAKRHSGRSRRGLEKDRTGAVAEHPPKEVLLERELGMSVEALHLRVDLRAER